MRECRSSGSVEGVMGNHDSYSDVESPQHVIVPVYSSRGSVYLLAAKRVRRFGAQIGLGAATRVIPLSS